MLKSYEAIYDNGYLQWLGKSPRLNHARVMVVIAESDEDETPQTIQQDINGPRLAKIIEETDSEILASIAEKFGDPVEWQREQRRERLLPGREED
ncbi:MAG: hypothetical protein NTX45_26500 [Proteobacteria bacterium]|nr:hypothetical protein [Pseudomonadota bacterium]